MTRPSVPVLLVDDLRTFRDHRPHLRATTSGEAVALLEEHWDGLAALWLDHDLGLRADGTPDTTLPVLDLLAAAAADGRPHPIGLVVVHTANPVGAATLLRGLRRWGYRCQQRDPGWELVEASLPSPAPAVSS